MPIRATLSHGHLQGDSSGQTGMPGAPFITTNGDSGGTRTRFLRDVLLKAASLARKRSSDGVYAWGFFVVGLFFGGDKWEAVFASLL